MLVSAQRTHLKHMYALAMHLCPALALQVSRSRPPVKLHVLNKIVKNCCCSRCGPCIQFNIKITLALPNTLSCESESSSTQLSSGMLW